MNIEISEIGLEKINSKIDEIQDKTVKGIINPSFSLKYLKEIRAELFTLLQTIRNECVIVNDTNGPSDPNAA